MDKYLYLLLNLGSIAIPFAYSFESNIQFYKKWKALFLGTTITAAFFIIWDVWFAKIGIWGFNPNYLLGIDLFNLPLEEWLFFFCIPYACMFIYESMKHFVKRDVMRPFVKPFYGVVLVILLACVVIFYDNLYTTITFALTAILIALHLFVWKSAYLGRFLLAYLIALVPFLIVNGVLTGSFIEDQVVWYNNDENLSIRIFTIPIEDTIYMMLMLLMNTTIYEKVLANSK